jgi:hypothetical protein
MTGTFWQSFMTRSASRRTGSYANMHRKVPLVNLDLSEYSRRMGRTIGRDEPAGLQLHRRAKMKYIIYVLFFTSLISIGMAALTEANFSAKDSNSFNLESPLSSLEEMVVQ